MKSALLYMKEWITKTSKATSQSKQVQNLSSHFHGTWINQLKWGFHSGIKSSSNPNLKLQSQTLFTENLSRMGRVLHVGNWPLEFRDLEFTDLNLNPIMTLEKQKQKQVMSDRGGRTNRLLWCSRVDSGSWWWRSRSLQSLSGGWLHQWWAAGWLDTLRGLEGNCFDWLLHHSLHTAGLQGAVDTVTVTALGFSLPSRKSHFFVFCCCWCWLGVREVGQRCVSFANHCT